MGACNSGPCASCESVAAAFISFNNLTPVLVTEGVGTPACYSRTRRPAAVRVLVVLFCLSRKLSRVIVVGIATGYGLEHEGSEFDSR
jgi:hypothetical protein